MLRLADGRNVPVSRCPEVRGRWASLSDVYPGGMNATNYLLWVYRLDWPDQAVLLRPGWEVRVGGGDGTHVDLRLHSTGAAYQFLYVSVDGDLVRVREHLRGSFFRLHGRPLRPEAFLRPGDRIEAGPESLRLELAPAVDPAWLAWGGGVVLRLARDIDETDGPGRLPLLADALEDAGCGSASLLDHLRCPRHPHDARRCWAVELVLGGGVTVRGRRSKGGMVQ